MFLIILLGTLISIIIGIISGLIPSLHINNVIYLINAISFSPEIKAMIFILSSIIFSFLAFIPATLLSIPNTDNFVSILPSQRLTLKGKAYFAIYLYLTGIINAIIFGLPLIILFILIMNYLILPIKLLTPFVLILALIILFFQIKNYLGILIILFSALLGFFSLSYSSIENPLLIIISGLFAMSNLIFVLQTKITHINQTFEIEKIEFFTKIKIGIIAPCLSIFVTLFPGLGNGFATYFGTKIGKFEDYGYIMLNGAINILVMILSFFSILIIDKSRTASGIFLEYYKNTFVFSFQWIIFFCLIGIVLGYFLTLIFAKLFIKNMHKINYKKLTIILILFLHAIIILFSNIFGLLVFWLATLIGYLCIKTENPRILLMACILFPVLLYFL